MHGGCGQFPPLSRRGRGLVRLPVLVAAPQPPHAAGATQPLWIYLHETTVHAHMCPSEAERGFRRVQADVRRLCDMVDSEWTLEREEGEWKMFMQTDPATGGIRYMGQVKRRPNRSLHNQSPRPQPHWLLTAKTPHSRGWRVGQRRRC